MSTYRERREARAERLREWAEKREAKAEADRTYGEPYKHDWAFITQPGRIIERERVNAHELRAWEHQKKAESMASRADEIGRQLETSIYDDDPDAIDALRAKLAKLEAKRETMKQANAVYRKAHRAELKALTPYGRDQAIPYASWELQNLGGNITRTRDRIKRLEARQARTGSTAKPARLIPLKYAGKCAECGTDLERGTMAYYDRSARELTCQACRD